MMRDAVNNRDFKIQRRGRQRGRKKKTIRFISKTRTLHMHHAFLYTSLPVFARPRRENAYSRFMEYVNKQRPNFVSLSALGYGP